MQGPKNTYVYPAIPKRWVSLYENVVDIINRMAEIMFKSLTIPPVIRMIKLAKNPKRRE